MTKGEKIEQLVAQGVGVIEAAKKVGATPGAYYSRQFLKKKRTKGAPRKGKLPQHIVMDVGGGGQPFIFIMGQPADVKEIATAIRDVVRG